MIISQINKTILYSVFLSIIGIILYGHTLWFSFTPLDDNELILKNITTYQDISNVPNLFLKSIDQSVNAPFYRPILMISFVVDSVIGNGNLYSFHLTNLIIHIWVSILIFILFELTTNSKNLAFLGALLFLIHPIHTQAVVWIPGRNDTLMTFFSLLSIISLMKYVKTKRIFWLFFNILFFLFAMYTKEQAVLLIFIFGYISYTSSKDSKFISLFLLWAASTLLFLIPRSLIMTGDFVFNIESYSAFVVNIIKAFIISVGKIILPIYQSVLPSGTSTPKWPGILSIFVITVSIFAGKVRKNQFLVLGALWFLIMGIVPIVWGSLEDLHFEHRLYLPSIGIILILLHSGVISSIYEKSPKGFRIGIIVILTILSVKTWHRSFSYYNEYSFANSAVNEAPNNYRSYYIMGNVLKSGG